MRRFIREHISSKLALGSAMDDSAILNLPQKQLAMTTDSFVVSPLFFPGGNIGSLAVHGTVNDLAVAGAQPIAISLALILEEGLEISLLENVLESLRNAAEACNVTICTGDTKVVQRGAVDKLFINTTGVGCLQTKFALSSANVRAGDELIVSGPIGQHGMAVLCAREDLKLVPTPISDSAPLHQECSALLLGLGANLRCMRDATRGGISAVLHEWAMDAQLSMQIDESRIPVSAEVRGACELLGLDPLYVANEGTMLIAVARDHSVRALEVLRQLNPATKAAIIGQVVPALSAPVVIRRLHGALIPVDEPQGAPLPRIC
ncbi:MAG: hydrogenase expression/formation protein HypE [Planctomycetales bacterium]|nr:hydrogenase expression/formation protein HypE [Planctomycetales bacterium]